jgi:hypothetical protein
MRWGIPLAVFAISLLVFGFSAFLDPEPHHDGVQITPAIAVAEGLTIHRDVFDQYGPITAWLHAGGVEVFGPRLLTIRLITAVLLAASAALMVMVARRFIPSTVIVVGIVAAWVALWPGRSVDDATYLFLPWPSITFLAIQMVAAMLLLVVVEGRRQEWWVLVLLGATVSLGALTRPNYGVPLALAVGFALWSLVLWGPGTRPRAIWAFIVGLSAPGLAVAMILAGSGAVGSFVQDSILGPLSGEATDGTTSWFFYKNVVLLSSIPFLLTIIVVMGAALLRPMSRLWPWLLGIGGVLALTLWSTSSIEGSSLRNLILGRLTWAPALDHAAFQPLYAMFVLTPFVAGLVVMSRCRDGASSTVRMELSLLVLALASLTQCYPFIDPNHVWWAAPLVMILVAHVLIRSLTAHWRMAMAAVLLLPPLIIGLPRFIEYASVPRFSVSGGLLDGMWAPVERRDDIATANKVLQPPAPRANRFDCWNGIFAVWSGRYLADSSAFVNWAPGFDLTQDAKPDGLLVRCLNVEADGSPEIRSIPSGYREISIDGPVTISYYNVMYLQVLERVP